MLLSDKDILSAFSSGAWTITTAAGPVSSDEIERFLGPNSLDMPLGDQVVMATGVPVALDKPLDMLAYTRVTPIDCDTFQFQPGELYLAALRFAIDCTAPLHIGGRERYFVQHYASRSTIARLGLFTDLSAAFGDYGFATSFTLELFNASKRPVRVPIGSRVGQIFFTELSARPQRNYHQDLNHSYSHTRVGVPGLPATGPRAV